MYMFTITAATRIYLYRSPCDMRKSFDGLCGIVRSELKTDPLSGSLFVFCNRRHNLVKILYWERDGFVIFYKRLERGTFTLPDKHSADGLIDRRQLSMLMEGIVPKKLDKRYIIEH